MNNVVLKLLTGDRTEMEELQRVLESAPDYSHRITGVPPWKGRCAKHVLRVARGEDLRRQVYLRKRLAEQELAAFSR